MVQGHHRADSRWESGSVRPVAAAQPSSWPSLSRVASRLRARKRRPGIVAAMLRDIEGVSDSIMTVLATVVTTAAPLGAPTYTRRSRRWLKIAPIAAFLVAVAAGWWLYRSEIANHVEMTIPPATRASDDLAQVNQALQQERDKAETLARELAMAWRALRSQATALADNAAQNQELTDL